MTLRNQLYKITGKDEADGELRYEIMLNEQHFIYRAHFPGNSITPGVCIIQIAKELLEDHLVEKLSIKNVKNVKFLSVISPPDCLLLTFCIHRLSRDQLTGERSATITVSNNNNIKTKLSFTCTTDAHEE